MGDEKKNAVSIRIHHMSSIWPATKPFFNSTVAEMLKCVITHPPSTIKVGLQLGRGSLSQVTTNILKNDNGVLSFYKGLSGTFLKRFAFTSAYLASINEAFKFNDGKRLSIYQTSTCACISAWVVNPAELALVRMQADATLPASLRRNYRNVFHALYRIYAEEGAFALCRGACPQVARQFTLHTAQGVIFVPTIKFFKNWKHGDAHVMGTKAAILGATIVTGVCGSVCSLPFDYVKTQVQAMQPNAEGKYPYTGSIDCAIKTFKSGGLFKFYPGLSMYCLSMAPQVMLILVISEYILKIERFWKL